MNYTKEDAIKTIAEVCLPLSLSANPNDWVISDMLRAIQEQLESDNCSVGLEHRVLDILTKWSNISEKQSNKRR